MVRAWWRWRAGFSFLEFVGDAEVEVATQSVVDPAGAEAGGVGFVEEMVETADGAYRETGHAPFRGEIPDGGGEDVAVRGVVVGGGVVGRGRAGEGEVQRGAASEGAAGAR